VILVITLTHNASNSLYTNVNRHKNILIIGKAATDYKLNQISYQSSESAVKSLYGASQLTDAFVLAKSMGVPDIFLANIQTQTDYIELIDVIKQYDFTYIVPLGIKFYDSFFNPVLNRLMTYAEFYLENIGNINNALILMTDNHASLYENIDAFLGDMSEKIDRFKHVAQKALLNGRNLCMVANNLQNYEYANLVLACALCTAEYSKYPEADFGPAIFDIDDFDVENLELVYFKNNVLTDTTVENLKNFRTESDQAKLINIDRVIKFIERELDFSEFRGKIFTDYIKLKIYNKLNEFLKSIVGVAILDYEIKSVEFVVTSPGAGSILNTFSILPINSIEEFDITIEV